MASYEDNAKFAKAVVPQYLLDEAIDWIKANLKVGDVFDESDIIEYVQDNVDIDDVYEDAKIQEYVRSSFDPDDVFTTADLDSWADTNGYSQ